jgi:hypothetical protein
LDMTTPSQEIQLGFGKRPQGNAVALFGSYVFVVGTNDKSDLQQSLYNGQGFSSASLGNKLSWTSGALSLPNKFSPKTQANCALSVLPGQIPALYLFWNQTNVGIMAAICSDVTAPNEGNTSPSTATTPEANWLAGLLLYDNNNMPMKAPSSACVSAVPLGSQAFLVAFLVEGGSTPGVAMVGLYYAADQQPNKTVTTGAGTFGIWPARAVRIMNAMEIGNLLPPQPEMAGFDLGTSISIAVTPQVAGTNANGDNALQIQLAMFLTITLENASHSKKDPYQIAVTCPLDGTGSPASGALSLAWSSGPTTKSPLTALSDPAGRVVASGASLVGGQSGQQNTVVFHTFSTNGSLQYATRTIQTAPSGNTSIPVGSFFVVDSGNAGTPSKTQNSDGSYTTSTPYPLLLLVFYGETTVAQVTNYGTAEVTLNSSIIGLNTPADMPSLTVTGIIDGPLPMPAANVINWQFESTNNDMGSVVYGTSASTTKGAQQDVSGGVSVTSEGQIGLFAGAAALGDGGDAGFAWDFTFNWSSMRSFQDSTTTTAAVTAVQESNASVEAGSMVGKGVESYGQVLTAGTTISVTSIKFLDAAGNLISDGAQSIETYTPQAPIFAATTPSTGASVPNLYVPYMVTPGDLMTYTIDGTRADGTPCGINATMAALTGGAIKDYFDSVIWPAAFDFSGGSGIPQKFLQFGWNLNGVTGEAFTAIAGTVQTSSWNIGTSMSAGLFWDVKDGAPLLGGVESKGELMAGGNFGYGSSTTTTTNDQWGISIAPMGSSPWGPPNWGSIPTEQATKLNSNWQNEVVAQYRFAMFFLPDPSANAAPPLCPGYWVQELIKYGNTNAPKGLSANASQQPSAVYLPANLDPGSGCWKICYVVLAIQTYGDMANNPPTYTYKYSDPDGRFA